MKFAIALAAVLAAASASAHKAIVPCESFGDWRAVKMSPSACLFRYAGDAYDRRAGFLLVANQGIRLSAGYDQAGNPSPPPGRLDSGADILGIGYELVAYNRRAYKFPPAPITAYWCEGTTPSS